MNRAPLLGHDGLKELVDRLNAKIGADNWAFSGSFAQYVIAYKMKAKSARRPNDVDVVVAERQMNAAIAEFNPGARPQSGSHAAVVACGYRLDILRNGSNLGSLVGKTPVDLPLVGRVWVVSTGSLVGRKRDQVGALEPLAQINPQEHGPKLETSRQDLQELRAMHQFKPFKGQGEL